MSKIEEPYILDRYFNTIGVLDVYKSFIWTDRYDEAGDFEITLPVTPNNLMLFDEDYYIVRQDSEHVMYVDMIEMESDAENGSILRVSGHSLEKMLDRRVVWKQRQVSGNLQNGIQTLLNENAINPSDSNRRIPGLKFVASTDKHVTDITVDTQFTGDSLYEAVVSLCQAAHLGFKITMPVDGAYEFRLYAGADRTYSQTEHPYIIFSPYYENLMNSNSITSYENHRTVALVGGEGEGSDRKYETVSEIAGPGSGLSRREIFIDARDVSSKITNNDGSTRELTPAEYSESLKNRGKEKLAEFLTITTFDGEAETSRSFEYMKDFNIGDLVQLETEYQTTFIARISEYIYSYDESSANEYPSFKILS